MSLRKTLGRVLFLGFLAVSPLMGVKMTPEDIEKLLNAMTRTRVVHILRREKDEE